MELTPGFKSKLSIYKQNNKYNTTSTHQKNLDNYNDMHYYASLQLDDFAACGSAWPGWHVCNRILLSVSPGPIFNCYWILPHQVMGAVELAILSTMDGGGSLASTTFPRNH